MAKDTGQIKQVLAALMKETFPELNGFQCPMKAKVTKIHTKGGRVGDFNKRYSVDVQPLKADGSIDDMKPVIPDVPIDIHWAGENRGILAIPPVGTVLRIGFYYWDPACPYVDGILADGYQVPEHPNGELVIQQKGGVFIKVKASGDIEIETNKKITLTAGSSKTTLKPEGNIKIESSTDIQLTSGKAQMTLQSSGNIDMANGALGIDPDGKIHLANGGPPIARRGDEVTCSCGTGRITGGSSRVDSG